MKGKEESIFLFRLAESLPMFYGLLEVMPWLENTRFDIQSADVVSRKLKNKDFQEPKLVKFKKMRSFIFKFSFRSLWYMAIWWKIKIKGHHTLMEWGQNKALHYFSNQSRLLSIPFISPLHLKSKIGILIFISYWEDFLSRQLQSLKFQTCCQRSQIFVSSS